LRNADEHHHHLARVAMIELSRLQATRAEADQSQQTIQQVWESVRAAEDFGTTVAGKLAIEMLKTVEDDDAVFRIISDLAPCAVAIESSPYLERHLLYIEFFASAAKTDWPRADRVARRLVGFEAKLWGGDSIENAHALTMSAYAQREIDRSSDADVAQRESRRIVSQLLNELDNAPVVAFLKAAVNDSEDVRPDYEWNDLYRMQRYNPPNVQQDVLNYELREAPQTSPDWAVLNEWRP